MSMANKDPEPVMTISELATYLRIAPSTVYRLSSEGKIPGRKVGGGWRFSRKTIEEWLAGPPIADSGNGHGLEE
jgi:excisionase family DNA binding protein